MAKKTKKQKIISQYRKQIQLLKLNQVSQPVDESIKKVIVTQKPEKAEKLSPLTYAKKTAIIENDSKIKEFFVKDLKKSLVIIVAIIGLEIIFYFASINHIFK